MSQIKRSAKKTLSRRKTRKETRNLALTRKKILNATFLQVFTRGFQGVSIDDIVAKTKLTKGAFYHQFPTKLDLGYALVDEVIKPMIIERWITPLESFENPLDGILFQMKELMGECEPAYLKFGCPLNNLVQEMAPVDKGFHQRLKLALNLWINEIARHLNRAKLNGYLRSEVKLQEVAHFIVMAHEGFYGMIKGLDDPAAFKVLYNSLKVYFAAISGPR